MEEALLKAFHYWIAGGPLLVPIALVCLGIWVYFLVLRRRLINALDTPPDLEEEIDYRLAQGQDPAEVSKILFKLNSLLPRISAYALKGMAAGKDIRDSINECRRVELPFFEREMLILAALVAAAPLLGLLGTVLGMINTFWAVSRPGGDTGNLVAAGISQALITTQFGLIVALPGVFGLAQLRRMFSELKVKIATYESHLLLGLGKKAANNELATKASRQEG